MSARKEKPENYWTVISVSLDADETAYDILKAHTPDEAAGIVALQRDFAPVAVFSGRHQPKRLMPPKDG